MNAPSDVVAPSAATNPGAAASDGPDEPRRRPARVPVAITEEIFLVLDRDEEPATMQFELRVSGPIGEGRLREALGQAVRDHPMMRAGLASGRLLLRRPRWEIGQADGAEVLSVRDCDDDGALDAIRAAHYSRPIPLDRAPAVRVLLVRRPGGDSLLFSVHHAVTDGIGALRFINSAARRYAGRPDPVPPVDPLAVRDLRATFGSSGPARRPPPAARDEGGGSVAPFAAAGAPGGPGYGICHASLSAEQCGRLDPRRCGSSATFNDLLLAALHLAAARWNAGRGQTADRVALLLPFNLRPPEWSNEVAANLVFVERNITTPEDRASPAALLAAVTAQTARVRSGPGALRFFNRPPWACWVITRAVLPLMLYRPRREARRDRGTWVTMIAANLGRIERKVSDFGPEAGALTEFWSSPPAAMPMGIAMTTALLNGRLCASLRYRRALLGDREAREFSDSFLEILGALGGPAD